MALLAVITAAAAGCAGSTTTERTTDQILQGLQHGLLGHASQQETLTLAAEGPIDVEVRNFAGDVVVRADHQSRHRDVQVELTRRATHEAGRTKESEASLPQITWSAEVVPPSVPDGVPTLVVTSATTHGEPWFQRLEVEILADQVRTVTVNTTRGWVMVFDNRGPVDIHTTKGDVRVVTPWPQTEPSTIVTKDGSIDWRVRGESTGLVDADTVGGKVMVRCEAGRWVATDRANDLDTLVATLNGGTNRITLRTVDGDIRVGVTGDPHATGSFAVGP